MTLADIVASAILRELIADDRYPCLCGEEPYTDGMYCPKCGAIILIESDGLRKPNEGKGGSNV